MLKNFVKVNLFNKLDDLVDFNNEEVIKSILSFFYYLDRNFNQIDLKLVLYHEIFHGGFNTKNNIINKIHNIIDKKTILHRKTYLRELSKSSQRKILSDKQLNEKLKLNLLNDLKKL